MNRMRQPLQETMQNRIDWVDREPRCAAILSVLVALLRGLLMGLFMGLFAGYVTSGYSKVLVYSANTFVVMLLRVMLQWFWLLILVPLVYYLVRYLVKKRTGQDVPKGIGLKHMGEEEVARSIVPAIVSVALATILATEDVDPAWLNQTWAIVVMAAAGGGVSALLEALTVPSNIYAIIHNRHRYQETLSYQSGPKRGNRASRRRRRQDG